MNIFCKLGFHKYKKVESTEIIFEDLLKKVCEEFNINPYFIFKKIYPDDVFYLTTSKTYCYSNPYTNGRNIYDIIDGDHIYDKVCVVCGKCRYNVEETTKKLKEDIILYLEEEKEYIKQKKYVEKLYKDCLNR